MPTIQEIMHAKRCPQPDHLDQPAALDRLELPDTEENRKWLTAAVRPILASLDGALVPLWPIAALDRLREHIDSITNQLPPNR